MCEKDAVILSYSPTQKWSLKQNKGQGDSRKKEKEQEAIEQKEK